MATELNVQIQPNELAQIVESVFGAMTGLDTIECGSHWFAGENRITAAAHFAGDWSGAVLLECNREQACRFAGRFLSIDPPESVDDVVRDVLGELANMIGGNLKYVLPQGIRLSTPAVVDGSDYALRICGAEIRQRLAFQCAGGQFWVMILTSH